MAHPLVTKLGLCLAAGRLGGSGDWSLLCRPVPVLVRAPPLGGPGPLFLLRAELIEHEQSVQYVWKNLRVEIDV